MLKKIMYLARRFQKKLLNRTVENYILLIVIVFFSILMVSQVGLVSDKIRPYISYIDVFEGRYISDVDSLVKEGTLTLQLIDMSKEKDVKVLVNGKVVSEFDNKTVDINVTNNSVVEIDSSKLKTPVTVRIISKSDNVIGDILNTQAQIDSCIKVLTRVKLK